jgi:hypothetical protein
MDPSLCKICIRRDRCARSGNAAWAGICHHFALIPYTGARAGFATTSVAKWIILCSDTQYPSFPLYLSLITHVSSQVLDPCGDDIPAFQPNFLLVRAGKISYLLLYEM